MKKLKTILNSKIFLILFILIAFIRVLMPKKIVFLENDLINKEFEIVKIIKKEYGYNLTLKSDIKILGYYYNNNFSYNLGDKVIIDATTFEYRNTIKNGFDYIKYLKNQSYNGIYIIDKITLKEENKSLFYKIKTLIYERAFKINNAYLNSLLLGDNSLYSSELYESFKNNGISHIFAISGFHIIFFIKILKKLPQKINFIIILLFLFFYSILLDFKISIMRSIIFHLYLILNSKFNLSLSNKKLLILTISSIILANPLAIYDIGFLYSSITALSFLIFLKNDKSYFKMSIKTSLLALFITFPLTVSTFYQINFLSILINLFATFYVSYILLPLSLITLLIPLLGPILNVLTNIFSSLSIFLSSNFDFLILIFGKMKVIYIIIYYILFILFLCFHGKLKLLFSILLLIFLVIHYFSYLFINDFYMLVDVGQGDSSIIFVSNKTLVIDTGESKNYYMGKKIINYLKSLGIKKIDYLLITHGDSDHMHDASYIVKNFKVLNLILNSNHLTKLEQELINTVNLKRTSITFLSYRDCFFVKEHQFCNLNKIYDDENNSSIVLYTDLFGYKFLFTGDIEMEAENFLIKTYPNFKVDILKVAHHGSRTSSSKAFINRIKPKYSVISVGNNNRYGHPNKEVLDNLNISKIYRTDKDGSIIFEIKKDNLKVETCAP